MKRQIKRAASVLLALTIALSAMLGTVVTAGAATDGISINATEVTIYALDEWAEEYISIPSDYDTSFQLSVSGAENVSYSSWTVNVSSDGLITPKIYTFYWYGNYGTTYNDPDQTPTKITHEVNFGTYSVSVYADGKWLSVKVNVVDYAEAYAQKVMDDYLEANITDDMTTYEKLEVIAKFVADREYSVNYSDYTGMIVSGGGDCWASTSTVIYMAQKAGLRAWSRNGNRDLYSGSGHKNAMVYDGVDYYEVEAGYSGNAPRYYSITKRNSLFSYYNLVSGGIRIYQYDEENVPSTLEIPSKIDGKEVVSIGVEFVLAYPMLSGIDNLENVILPDTLTDIKSYAFAGCDNLKSITIPQGVETIGEKAFGYTYELEKIDGFTIYGYKASAAEEYANENGFSFVALDGELLIGDVNGDGVVNVSDATALQKHIANGKSFDEASLKIADTNGDGEVTVADATQIQKSLADSVSPLG